MTPKQNGFKSFAICIAFLCMTLFAKTQTVTVSGTQPVDIGCEYHYTASVLNVPTDWTIVDYKWQATFIGPNGTMRYVSGFNGSTPVYTTTSVSAPIFAKTTDLWATWDGFHYPGPVQVIFQIRYTLPNQNTIRESGFYYTSPSSFAIRGIPNNPTLTGQTSVQKCCVSNVTYTVSNFGDANTFDQWTYPAGWTLVSQSGNSITLTPDASTGGSVICRIGISTACPPIYKTASISVTRNDAVISTVPGQFPANRICPNSSYSFVINPVCGATDYTWQFPSGFTITGYTNNKTVANVTTGANPVSGNIVITAVFNGCNSVSLSVPVAAITGAPSQVPTFNTDAPNYHCDAWYICRNGGSIPFIDNTIAIDVQSFTYTVSSGWYFRNASNQKVNTLTLPYNQSPPAIYSDICRTSGTYTVTANNCLGSSSAIYQPFTRESECWCLGTPPYPYSWGSNKPCLTPPSGCGSCPDPIPTRIAATDNVEAAPKKPITKKYLNGLTQQLPVEATPKKPITENKIYPNPASGFITIETKETGVKLIRIVSFTDRTVYEISSSQQVFKVDVSKLVQGIYFVEVKNAAILLFKKKIIVNKQ